jgi:glycosyltransferase involved in cell wall biosynthesis
MRWKEGQRGVEGKISRQTGSVKTRNVSRIGVASRGAADGLYRLAGANNHVSVKSHSLKNGLQRDPRVRLVFFTRNLGIGGAERQLVTLAKALDRSVFNVFVMCLYGQGELEPEVIDAGVPVVSLDKKGRWDLMRFSQRFVAKLRELRPDILHSYLTIQNLLAVLAKPALPKATRVIWGIRASNVDLRQYDWLARLSCWLESRASGSADLIIFNSNSGMDHYLKAGFAGNRALVIPNGVDTQRFAIDRDAGSRLRASWRVPEACLLVGIVARMDPMKDHRSFLKAAALVAGSRDDARFVCIGTGPEQYVSELKGFAAELGIGDKMIWPGAIIGDLRAAYNALNICCSSSSFEGTSNAIAEAMACGVPCVATDVGDSRLIVGETGFVVPANNSSALAAALIALANRIERGQHSSYVLRERIETRFGLPALVRKTSEAFLELV